MRQIPWGAIRAPAEGVPGVVRESIRKAYSRKEVRKDMGLFADGFKELKKASEPLYKTPKSSFFIERLSERSEF